MRVAGKFAEKASGRVFRDTTSCVWCGHCGVACGMRCSVWVLFWWDGIRSWMSPRRAAARIGAGLERGGIRRRDGGRGSLEQSTRNKSKLPAGQMKERENRRSEKQAKRWRREPF